MYINYIFLIIGFAVGSGFTFLILFKRIKKLNILSKTDDLTGIRNYRDLNEALTNSSNKKLWSNNSHVFILLDLDNFKEINDHLGYEKGDETLKQFTDFLGNQIRKSDLLYRYKQGDEFVLIVKAPINNIEIMINRIINKLESESPKLPSFSYGYSNLIPDEIDKTIKLAEAELKRMKQS